MQKLSGGCFCGDVRFSCDIAGDEVIDICHCTICQRLHAAPMVAWVQLPPNRFELTKGTAKPFKSSEQSTRHFCNNCGSQLHMTDAEGRSVGVPTTLFDHPANLSPTVHGWWRSRVQWLDSIRSLPSYTEAPPYDL